jgi:DNA primase
MDQLPGVDDYRAIRFSRLEPAERARIYGASRITLSQDADGEMGRWYLAQRGLDVATIASFRLGYVPFKIKHPFSGRIVMPIMDAYGELLALSLRPVINGVDPKYWNESFVKGEHLYGLWQAKYAIARMGFSVIVEGQIDACSMHAHGFCNTVGLLGGALTPIQSSKLRRWTKRVVLLMDGDAAGAKHAEAARDILDYYVLYSRKASGIDFRYVVASLPAGHDPASFLRQYGSQDMRRLLADSMMSGGMQVPRVLSDDGPAAAR